MELDIGPISLLNADLGRAKINARPRNKRAPTAAHLRLRQHAAELIDDDDSIALIDSNIAVERTATASNIAVEKATTARLTEQVSYHSADIFFLWSCLF